MPPAYGVLRFVVNVFLGPGLHPHKPQAPPELVPITLLIIIIV